MSTTTAERRERYLTEGLIVEKDPPQADQPRTWGVYQWASDGQEFKFRAPVRTGFATEGDAEKWARAKDDDTEKKPWQR